MLDPYSPGDNYRQLWVPVLCLLGLAGGWGAGSGRRLVLTLLCLAACLPGWSGRVKADVGGEVVAAARAGTRVAPVVRDGGRVLILSEGLTRWPTARPDACELVIVYARAGSADVVCDSEVADVGWGEEPGSGDAFRRWLAISGVSAVARVGDFEDWRPIQRAATGFLSPRTGSPRSASTDPGSGHSGWGAVLETSGLTVWAALGRAREELPGLEGGGPVRAAAQPDADAVAPTASHVAVDCAGGGSLPADIQLTGAAVQREPAAIPGAKGAARVAFYTNGTMRFRAATAGAAHLEVCGSEAEGSCRRPGSWSEARRRS